MAPAVRCPPNPQDDDTHGNHTENGDRGRGNALGLIHRAFDRADAARASMKLIEGEDGVRTVFALQEPDGGVESPLVVDALADDKVTVDGDTVLPQGLQIAMLAATYHVEMVWPADEGDTAAARIYQVLGSLLGCDVAVGCDAGELLRQASASEKHQGDIHL